MKLAEISLALLLAITPGIASAQFQNISSPTGSATPIPNFTPNGGLSKWKIARTKVVAGTANATVLAIGESTPRGFGAMFNGTSNDAASGAWPAQVALQLRQACDGILVTCINAQNNSFSASGNIGNAAAFAAYDTRVAVGTWTVPNAGNCYTSGNLAAGGCIFQSADTASAFTFNPKNTTTYPSAPTVPTNVADVYSANINLSAGFGVLTVNVNGGATLASIAQNGAGAITYTKTTVSTGSAAADNTWNMKCSVTSLCLFDTVVLRNSAVSEASFINMGMGGATVGNWNISGAVYNPLAAIQNVYVPDLCMIQDQGNDQNLGTPIATYKSNLHGIIAACAASGSALIVTSQQGKPLAAINSPAANSTLTCAANVVTVTTSVAHGLTIGNTPWIVIAGVTPSGYNGNYQATITGASAFTYPIASCPGAETVPGTWGGIVPPYDTQALYAAAAVAQAATDSVPVLDWFTTMCGTISGSGTSSTCSQGGWNVGVANGWNGSFNGGTQDIVHQGPYAYGPLATQVAAILRQ